MNEDSVKQLERNGKFLFVLADGLGGHGHGECASGLAVTTSSEMFNSDFFKKIKKKSFFHNVLIVHRIS